MYRQLVLTTAACCPIFFLGRSFWAFSFIYI